MELACAARENSPAARSAGGKLDAGLAASALQLCTSTSMSYTHVLPSPTCTCAQPVDCRIGWHGVAGPQRPHPGRNGTCRSS